MNQKTARARFIFITVLLDGFGVGLLIPVLPDILGRFSSDVASIAQSFGYFIAVYSLMQFLASPILGALSDRYGRRPILLISMLGAAIDYVVMAFAPSLPILFLGRIVSGLTGASATVAAAYMADISDDENRSANFGLIGAAGALGFIVGPALGGLLGTFGPKAPFLVAASLSLVNFLFGLLILPESLASESRRKLNFLKLNPLSSMKNIFRPSPVRMYFWIYILVILAGSSLSSNWTLFTKLKFQWAAAEVGLSLTCVGISGAIVQGYLTRILMPKLGERRALTLAIMICLLSFLGFAFATHSWMLYAILVPFAFSGISNPALQSLISKKVPSNEQGELQGTLISLASLTAIISPIFYSYIFSYFTRKEAQPYFPGSAYLSAALITIVTLSLWLRYGSEKSA